MKIDEALHEQKQQTLAALRNERQPWWSHWRELADYYLPRRYVWLLNAQERSRIQSKNPMILDSTGTTAARTLASGMMNGITSPSRPWFKLRMVGFGDDISYDARVWLDEVQRRMLLVMAESNFYNAMAITYLDLTVFGSTATLIYEDYESVIRCYNSPLGEFYLGQSARQVVNTFAREFTLKVAQVVERWGIENCSETVKDAWNQGGARLQQDISITHLIEPNDDRKGQLKGRFSFREYYWETAGTLGTVLEQRGFREMPGIFPRWELLANDAYGSSPAMDALGDVIQLQHETKKKAQGLDKMISPPVIADIQLQHKPMALLPNGITYVAGVNSIGVKPAYSVQVPIGELGEDIAQVQMRVREKFHNDLFKMISQLDTVRSATEIDARREEKLVLLGPVLERFENEALDPAIKRIYAIMERAGLLPEVPESVAEAELEIQYMSILTAAQTAVAAIPTERWLQLIGNVSALYPDANLIPQYDDLIRRYGRDIGVREADMKDKREVDAMKEARAQEQEAAAMAQQGQMMVEGAKTLSETDVGGGANALQQMIGG
jgi:hypothetical protein